MIQNLFDNDFFLPENISKNDSWDILRHAGIDCFLMTVVLKITFLKIDVSPRKTQIISGREPGSTSHPPVSL